ncbi:AraC family transcriptional regulator [Flavobacterium sp. PL02]|jgi:AraC family transcriptional activator of pyochelin receptor|uniref:helix-turn-helix domain-containing protein n=1 Tax=Flavobacterium sp. PL02 TaxID=3088354 RepID=UPI002B23B221|nr:AraC family transcriptional regulator [Flavobacterium sp. PL02]MEA9414724.1 AraC family transcriptional regulator [Flavobacterium sp. PL02]
MTTDIIEINNFVVLIEQSNAEKTIIEKCEIDGDAVGFAFYGSGNVELEITYENNSIIINNTTGIAISFFGNSKVGFAHKISPNKPLQSISVFMKIKNLNMLPERESEIFSEYLQQLLNPEANFVEGPSFYMSPDMQNAVQKIFNTQYKGDTRLMFLKSQITELLAHFFAHLATEKEKTTNKIDRDKLFHAKEIMTQNIATPPSLSELSKQIGLNNNKLKKNFKELFGIPVFKYLQEQRLNKAHELLSNTDKNIQETAWFVGYESLSSFSNAFHKKFGVRPSELKK